MSLINDIENSSVIQTLKEQYNAAKARGDDAAAEAAHEAANAYREEQGGYKDVYTEGGGTNFDRVITNASLLDRAVSVVNDMGDTIKDVTGVNNTQTAGTTQTSGTTIIDSAGDSSGTYNPTNYMPYNTTASTSGTSTSFDELLGFGVIALVAIAVLSRLIGGK